MFIRARKRQLKNGRESVTYQLVESVREGKKVKSKVICGLGYEPTIQGAIAKYQSRLYYSRLFFKRESEKYRIRSQKAHQRDLGSYQKGIDRYSNLISKLNSLL